MSIGFFRRCLSSAALPVALTVALPVAVGCGGSDGDAHDPVTIDTLPPEQREAFEAWKAQPIKGCDWAQAFAKLADDVGARADDSAGVDVAALYARTGGSPVIAGAGGEIAVLGAPRWSSASGSHAFSQTTTINGETRTLSVESTIDGGTCVITLGDDEVYRGEIATSIELAAYTDAQVASSPTGALGTAELDTSLTFARIGSNGLLKQPLAALAPNESAYPILASKLGTDAAAIKGVVVLAGQAPALVQPKLDAPAFAPGALIYGSRAEISGLAGRADLQLDLLYAPASTGVDSVDRALASQLIVVRATVAIDANGPHATSFVVQPNLARSDAAMGACFARRSELASAFVASAPRAPRFDESFDSCAALAVDGYAALAADPSARQRIATVAFTGPLTPSAIFGGWDNALIAVASRLAGQGVALDVLDPGSALPALDAAIARSKTYVGALPSASLVELRPAVLDLVLRWALHGVFVSVDADEVIPAALHNGTAYPLSLVRMLSALATSPNNLAAASCAAALTGDRATRVAATISRAAALTGAASFTSDLRDNLFQQCPSDAALASIDAAADAAGAFVKAETAREGGISFAATLDEVVDHALRERWTSSAYNALNDLLALGLLSEFTCTIYKTQSEQLRCIDPGLDRFSAASGGLLAPALVARHVAFARALLPIRRGWLDGIEFINTRFDIENAFFDDGLWTGCSDAGFAASQAKLFDQLEQLRKASVFDRPAIQDAIADRLAAQTCS